MTRFSPITTFLITLVLCLALALNAHAQFDTVDTKKQSVTFSLAGQNTNSTTAVTAATPINRINGYAGIFVSRQTADDEVVSEVANARVQGGYKFIDGYIEVERDLHRGIEFETKIGYFLIPGTAQIGPFRVTGGAGNYTANTAVKETLGITDQNPVSFGWTAFATVDFWKTSTTLTTEPDLRFESVELEAESTIRHAIAEDFEVGLTVKGQFDSDPITEGRFHSQYLLFATWKR